MGSVTRKENILEDKKKDSTPWKPQPEAKKAKERTLVATQTCTVELESATVVLVEGDEVHGLTRQERDHLVFHGFVE